MSEQATKPRMTRADIPEKAIVLAAWPGGNDGPGLAMFADQLPAYPHQMGVMIGLLRTLHVALLHKMRAHAIELGGAHLREFERGYSAALGIDPDKLVKGDEVTVRTAK